MAYRGLMVWLFNRAGHSVFAVTLFHPTINLCGQLFRVRGSFYDPQIISSVAAVFALGVVLAVAKVLAFFALSLAPFCMARMTGLIVLITLLALT